ncbi:protein serine/threonine phosphatase [Catenulispora acidiphila DSM 44928]|uniref:Protein serine/threonine phosphatase n=1 Tax=Catenulispora acidiphila (strain DSM 44928 / JCM 14897 / NBRC 102108 / NRRL B-24433 / ID139908) TaxID=479433 RepID=C7QHG1_CATAD|nr:PP2C family protein-serine/threonine phosphatase [Catenulispora acidiphila]ACU69100.1 protein serine/threonine phosphatase [Catenulispora acidiphila DSM 44928]
MAPRTPRTPLPRDRPEEAVRLTLLSQAGELLAGTLDRRRLAALASQLIVPRLADWVALYPPAADHSIVSSSWSPEHLWHREERKLDALAAALADWHPPTGEDGHVPGSGSGRWPVQVASPYGQALPIPLAARGVSLGTLVLGGPGKGGFAGATLPLLMELAGRISGALDNARQYAEQVEIVRGLQRSLLPPSLPTVDGLDIGVVYEAASNSDGVHVGGDFYDVFPISRKVWGFAVGDVCGTGPEAAALTGLARHSLRLLAREGRSPVTVVERLNQAVLEEGELAGDAGRFITLLYGEVEPRPDGSAQLVLVCAGHPLPLVLRQDGSVRAAANPQPLLGVLPDPTLYAEDVELGAGEVLLVYTDGASERRNGRQMLGDEGVAAALAGCSGMTAPGVVARVRQAVADFGSSGTRDDLALLALRAYKG